MRVKTVSTSKILTRLQRLRATLRRRLVLYGLFALGTAGLDALLVLLALDWALGFPPFLRAIHLGIFVIALGTALVHWVLRPLTAKLSIVRIAGQLEAQFHGLNDRLASAIRFLQAEGDGSPAMQREVIQRAEAMVQRLPLRETLTWRPLLHRAGFFAASVMLLLIILTAAPQSARISLHRFLTPFNAPPWPTRVKIVPLTGDAKIARGEHAIVRMRIARGARRSLRGVLHLRDAEGRVQTLAMHRQADGRYACTIGNLTETLTYWFEAGDDSTVKSPGRLNVVSRPTVVELLGWLQAPSYAAPRPPKEVDLTGSVVRAVLNSRLVIALRASKPIARDDDDARTLIRLADGATAPLTRDAEDPTRLRGELTIDRDLEFTIELLDEDGFVNVGGNLYRVKALADAPPEVRIIEPRAALEVTPDATLTVVADARDDLGLRAAALLVELPRGGGERAIDLPLQEFESDSSAGSRVARLEHRWSLSPLGLQPGDFLRFHLRAWDRFVEDTPKGQMGRSPTMRVAIVSPEVFVRRWRETLAGLEERVRDALLKQERLLDDAANLTLEDSGTKRRAANIANAQTRLADRLRETARRLKALADRGQIGQAMDEAAPLAAPARSIAKRLRDAADGPMREAARSFSTVNGEDPSASDHAAKGLAHQHVAREALARAVRDMERGGDFEEVVRRARRLLDKQQHLRATTLRQGEATLGRAMDDLSETQRQRAWNNERAQRALREDTDSLFERMRILAAKMNATDVATASAVADALRVGVAAEIVHHMHWAAEALAANRTLAAGIAQRSAETGIADLLAALQERQKRKLNALAKSLEGAEHALGRIITDQQALRSATSEALQVRSQRSVIVELGRGQHRLEGNTRRLADSWQNVESLAPRADRLRTGAAFMGEASVVLLDGDGSAALDPQQASLSALESIAQELAREAEQVRSEARRQQLAQTRTRLEALRARQDKINATTAQIIDRLQTRPRLTRMNARKIAAASRAQDALHDQAETLRRALEEAVVYDFVLQRAVSGMRASADALSSRRLDDELAETQERVVTDLDLLIAALVDLNQLPSPDEFARSGGGGRGGTRDRGADAVVPKLAELLVLKAMQESLIFRTRKTARNYDPDTATEQRLRTVRRLADEQQSIRNLTRRVTEKAKHHAN